MSNSVPILTVDQLATRAAWPARAHRDGWVRANLAMSLDGSIVGPAGTSASISTPSDHDLMIRLRNDADAIIVGASTARAERYHRSQAQLVVVSRSLQGLAEVPAFVDAPPDRPRPIVLTCTAADPDRLTALAAVAEVIVAGEDDVDLALALSLLASRGMRRVHCEGGAHLVAQLIEQGLLDELHLTITPILAGGTGSTHLVDHLAGGRRDLQCEAARSIDGSVFLRCRP